MKLSVKHLNSIADLTKADISKIYSLTKILKTESKKGKFSKLLKNKTIALLFEKPSTRTRVSFEVGMFQLGGNAIDLSKGSQLASGHETLEDTVKVLGRYVNGLVVRLYEHKNALEMAKVSTVPVINGLTNLLHPCQVLSDIYTIKEKRSLKNLTITFLGDGRDNVAHSLINICEKLGIDLRIACPRELRPLPAIAKDAKYLKIYSDPLEAVKGADVLYTDVWVSMGQEKSARQKIKILRPYQLNSKVLSHAKKDAFVMHCLPAHRGQEITDKVMDGPNSIILDQAENRLHVQKAILALLL